MMDDSSLREGEEDMAINLSIKQVYPNTYNVNRMDEDAYRRLVEDMKIGGPGSVDPISVRETKDGYEIVDGAHRYRVARELGQSTCASRTNSGRS